MIHIVFDTNIYRSNPDRSNLHFKAIEKLLKAKVVQLHIPYIVLREFQTQQREIYLKDLTKAISGISGLSKKNISPELFEKLISLKIELKEVSETLLHDAESQIVLWANDVGAKIYPLCIDQTNAALEAYFQGKPPLKSIKIRDDIPDSFVVQAILKILNENGKVYVVAGDIQVREAFLGLDNIITYKDFSSFVESDLIQNELKDIDLISNIGSIANAMKKYEVDTSEISRFINANVGEKIVWESFHDPSIPDDNNEAIINSYGEVSDTELDFQEIGYYGNGEFGIPFTLKISVYANYYIFKSDYYCMDSEFEHVPSVTDHNDHYFEAEDEFELEVSGLASIAISRDLINLENISDSIIDGSINIDEIETIRLWHSSD